MPGITDRATKPPLLNLKQINHGTLYCTNLAKTRRFYEEVLGITCIQLSDASMMIRKDSGNAYAVLEVEKPPHDMHLFNHNGFAVETPADVDACHRKIAEVKEEYGIKRVTNPTWLHGDYSFYLADLDHNWWEIAANGSGEDAYSVDFSDPSRDLSGRHDVEDLVKRGTIKNQHLHMHNPDDRALIAREKP